MRTSSRRSLYYSLLGLCALSCCVFSLDRGMASAATTTRATVTDAIPTAVATRPVALLVDYKLQANGLPQATAIQRANALGHFTFKAPKNAAIPQGMKLQQINIQRSSGAYSPLVTYLYAVSPSHYGFRVHEQVLSKGQLPDRTGHAMRVGKTTVYVTTSLAYVYITWSDGKMAYSVDNVTTKNVDIDQKGLLAIVSSLL